MNKYLVKRVTVEKQVVEARDEAHALDESEHYPFPSQWDESMSYTVEKI